MSPSGTARRSASSGTAPGPGNRAATCSGFTCIPPQAGHGTGRSLLSHAEQRLREQGSDTISLHVFEANERARRLYAKAGYTPDGSTRVEPEYEATEVRLVKVFS
jgi:GNAT superfamily N-acetyltransferase